MHEHAIRAVENNEENLTNVDFLTKSADVMTIRYYAMVITVPSKLNKSSL